MNIKQSYNKNQFIIEDGTNEKWLQSYNSTVAHITKSGRLEFGIDWNYSKTTLKHLYLFIQDYSLNLDNNFYKLIFTNKNGAHCTLYDRQNKKAFFEKLVNDKKIGIVEL